MFELEWTDEAQRAYSALKKNPAQGKRCKAIKKTINFLSQNPRHNSLQTYEYERLTGPNREKVFEAYAEQKTPAAYRVFWYYEPKRGVITIFAITPHP